MQACVWTCVNTHGPVLWWRYAPLQVETSPDSLTLSSTGSGGQAGVADEQQERETGLFLETGESSRVGYHHGLGVPSFSLSACV